MLQEIRSTFNSPFRARKYRISIKRPPTSETLPKSGNAEKLHPNKRFNAVLSINTVFLAAHFLVRFKKNKIPRIQEDLSSSFVEFT
jgi:hypothetical protein